jgi:hypothetical protein
MGGVRAGTWIGCGSLVAPVEEAAQLGAAGRTDQAQLRLIVLERVGRTSNACGCSS